MGAVCAVCAGAKRSNTYLVNTILGVIMISQDQWDIFNQLGPSRRDAPINSVQSKCGKHGRFNEVGKRGSPNPASNMRWGGFAWPEDHHPGFSGLCSGRG